MEATQIVLGGTAYIVSPFNVGQRRRLVAARALRAKEFKAGDESAEAAATVDYALDLVKIALERATPPVADGDSIEASEAELSAAIAALIAADK